MTDKYYAYRPEAGFYTFETEKEAIEYAKESLEHYQDTSSEGWDENVLNVSWGLIRQHIVKTLDLTPEQAEEQGYYYGTLDGIEDYGLVEIEKGE